MKNIIFIFSILFLASSCSLKHCENNQLKKNIIHSIKNGNLNNISIYETGLDNDSFIYNEFNNPNDSIYNMQTALNKGFFPLIEDISHDKFKCEKEILITNNYKFTDWETRNIGFVNWPIRAKGGVLLQEIKILNLKKIIMMLLNEKDLNPLIIQNQVDLNKAISELSEMSHKLVD